MITYKQILILFTLITFSANAAKIFVPREVSLIGEIGIEIEIPTYQSQTTKMSEALTKIQEAWNQTFDDHYNTRQFILLDRLTKKPIYWLNNEFPIDYQKKEAGVSFIIGEYVRIQVQIGTHLFPPKYAVPLDYLTNIINLKRKLDLDPNNVDLFLVRHSSNEVGQDSIVALDGDSDNLFNRMRALCPEGFYHIIAKYKSLPTASTARPASAPPTTTKATNSYTTPSALVPSQSTPAFPTTTPTFSTQPGPERSQ